MQNGKGSDADEEEDGDGAWKEDAYDEDAREEGEGQEEGALLMPAGFDACVKAGGRVRTMKLGKGKYMHICWLKGKSYSGEVKTKKKKEPAGR